MDNHKNLAYSTVAVAPVPAASGLTVTVEPGHGSRFPDPPFNVTIWADGGPPTDDNAEIARCVAKVVDVLTLDRATNTEDPPVGPRAIVVGDQIAETITSKMLNDLDYSAAKVASRVAFRF